MNSKSSGWMRVSRTLVLPFFAGLLAAFTVPAQAQVQFSATTTYKFGRANQQDDLFGAYSPTASYLGLTISGTGFTTSTLDDVAELNSASANLGKVHVTKVPGRYNSKFEYLYVKLTFAAPAGVPDSLYFVGVLRDGTSECPVFIGFTPTTRCPACENSVFATVFDQLGTDDGESYHGGTFDVAINDQSARVGDSYLTGSITVYPQVVSAPAQQPLFADPLSEDPTPTPEPGAVTLLATGLLGVGIARRKRAA